MVGDLPRPIARKRLVYQAGATEIPAASTLCQGQVVQKLDQPMTYYFTTKIPKEVIAVAAENNPVTRRTQVPTLMIQGQLDKGIVPQLTKALAIQMCHYGSTVDYRQLEGDTHRSSVFTSVPLWTDWFNARFAGDPAPSTCKGCDDGRPVLIGLVAGLIALAGITGGDSAARTPGRAFLFGLPVFVAAGATILPFGAVWWSALAMALVTVLGMWLAGRLADRVSVTQPAGAATTVAAARSAVAVLLAAIAVRWLAPLIAALAPVSAVTVAVVCISAAVVAAVFGRGRLGLTRTVFIIAIVVAVLLLVIGVALGTPGGCSTRSCTCPDLDPSARCSD